MSTVNETTQRDIYATLREMNPEAMTIDGFEGAYLGICHRKGSEPVALYCRQKIVEILMERDGCSWEEAEEYVDYNVTDAWVGEGTPAFLDQEVE